MEIIFDKAKTLHGEDFEYENDHQRVSIIVEYMSFQVHLVDRLLFEDNMDSEFRAQVMNSLGKQSARIMQENCEDLLDQVITRKAISTHSI